MLGTRSSSKRIPGDGNYAASQSAYALSEVAFIYPITPATPMGDYFDSWIAQKKKNVWGNVVGLSTLQSEGGAAGAVHGASSVGSITTSFTASQGLLLMIPDLYKLVGEFCPAVIHVTARSLATGGLSIYNDHGDIYAARMSGIPMVCGNTVQESHDMAAISHLTTIKAGVPFINFEDGFRTSHEINTYEPLDNEVIKQLIDEDAIAAMRKRSLNPEHPSVRGPILGPEYVWTSVEKPNRKYLAIPSTIQGLFDGFGKLTGRYYKPFEYVGAPDAEYAFVAMGAGNGPISEYISAHPQKKLGLLKVRLYRPFDSALLEAALPKSVKNICVLDKYRDITAPREPLATDVAAALHGKREFSLLSGRYGIGSKDFGPTHVEAAVKNFLSSKPKDSFTVGIYSQDTEIPLGEPKDTLPEGTKQCIFWGLGSDGTVGSNKEAVKLIVDNTPLFGQAYFAYSAHKSGGLTNSHLRFGPKPIEASYFIQTADYVACHNPSYIKKFDVIRELKKGGTVVLNIPTDSNWEEAFPGQFKKKIAESDAKIYAIDASKIAAQLGLPGRINMLMQTVFFSLSGILPMEKCIKLLKASIEKQFKKKGADVVAKNCQTVDAALANLIEVKYDRNKWLNAKPEHNPDPEGFAKILKMQIEQRADDVSVEQVTEAAQMPPGTSKFEKRNIALSVPTWESNKCVQCNTCSMVCPHAVIRPFLLKSDEVKGLTVLNATGAQLKDYKYRIQISPYDCTGCGVCAQSCPAKALKMTHPGSFMAEEDKTFSRLVALPNRGYLTPNNNLKNVQFNQPLLEFNGACPGCGEPAIVKLVTQLYGDHIYIANATGCSIVWGGTYPWNPYTTNEKGHGPAWANSLFEDNAEFGFGMYHSVRSRRSNTRTLIEKLLKTGGVSGELKTQLEKLLTVWTKRESIEVAAKIQELLSQTSSSSADIKLLKSQADVLGKKSVWILGGDGWAYDIGYGGLDHVLASGDDVNVLVVDTEVYSNTGGQSSKATNRSAVAQFAADGYSKAKKDLGQIAITYGNIYVASTCLLANPAHALKAIQEAGEYNGPSLVINYAPCINHGISGGLTATPKHCKDLVAAGYVSLYRFNPALKAQGKNPFILDSKEPNFNLDPLLKREVRFKSLETAFPSEVGPKRALLLNDLKVRYQTYLKLAKQ